MDAIGSLIAGYRNFRAGTYRQNVERYQALASRRQQPKALIIACCDSRADPAMVFQSDPGELFVVRNVANLVPPYEPDSHYHGTSAALEFGVKALEIKDVIVMGHAACGGIEALYDNCCGKPASGDFIPSWISLAEPVAAAMLAKNGHLDRAEALRKLEQEAVIASLDRLRTFPFIKEREDAGTLSLHGWFYGIGSGILSIYEPETGRFRDIVS
ncbi:MAG: carbonic anhydrase [Parvibaculaceae bacterium]|nr:carbonic anhydrase [Parvibaculaceae bacterium]